MKKDDMIDAEEIELGGEKFTISRIPAMQAQQVYGEVVRIIGVAGDIGMTYLPIDISKKMLSYVAYYDSDTSMWLTLDDEKTVDKAFKDLFVLIELEAAMIRKNFGFLLDGRLLKVLDTLRGSLRA